MNSLFGESLGVITVGPALFADGIRAAGGEAVAVDWSPPGDGDPRVAMDLARLVNDATTDAANRTAFERYLAARPVLEGIAPARDVVPGMDGQHIIHAGPPVAWEAMCGPMRGAIVGAILYEGWASDPAAAETLAGSGTISFAPCHHHDAVGPMAGVMSPSMPVWRVKDSANNRITFSNLNEGLGRVLRFGAYDAEVLDRLKWIEQTLAPVLAAGLAKLEGLDLLPLMAQALHMGDEVHNRNAAATSLLLRRLAPAILATDVTKEQALEVIAFIAGNDHFFLNISMAACKAMTLAAHGVAGSSLVTAMARNGIEFGIRVSGAGDTWFTRPAPIIDGLFFPGYDTSDAAADLGDSAITETAGIGGFAMAAAPAIVQFVGGTPADALRNTREMGRITQGPNSALTLPALGFTGTPAGIDARKALDTGIAPIINTGIAHKDPGVGQIGAGITRAPIGCFADAIAALAARLEN
jgi:hypothetical protein